MTHLAAGVVGSMVASCGLVRSQYRRRTLTDATFRCPGCVVPVVVAVWGAWVGGGGDGGGSWDPARARCSFIRKSFIAWRTKSGLMLFSQVYGVFSEPTCAEV